MVSLNDIISSHFSDIERLISSNLLGRLTMFKKAILNPRSLGRQLILFGKLQVMLVLSLFWGVLFISFVKVWLDLPGKTYKLSSFLGDCPASWLAEKKKTISVHVVLRS